MLERSFCRLRVGWPRRAPCRVLLRSGASTAWSLGHRGTLHEAKKKGLASAQRQEVRGSRWLDRLCYELRCKPQRLALWFWDSRWLAPSGAFVAPARDQNPERAERCTYHTVFRVGAPKSQLQVRKRLHVEHYRPLAIMKHIRREPAPPESVEAACDATNLESVELSRLRGMEFLSKQRTESVHALC